MCQSQSVGLGSYERASVEVNRMKGHEDRYRKVIVILLKSPCCGLKLFAHELWSKCFQKLLSLSYLFNKKA